MGEHQTLINSQFYLTSSDFSDIANFKHELREISSSRVHSPDILLKVAKFKQLDWKALDGKIIPKEERIRN